MTRKLSQVTYNYYKNETFALGMVVFSIVCQQDVQAVYNRGLRSFNMKLFERMKNEVRRIETENHLERNFLKFVMNYMINVDERKRLSPKQALKVLSKLVKKFSGEPRTKQTMTLIEEAQEGGLGEYLSKREDPAEPQSDLAGTGGEEPREAGRVQTMREILKIQTEQLDKEEKMPVEEEIKSEQEEKAQTSGRKRKKKNKKRKKKMLERLSLLNLRKIQKKISRQLTVREAEKGLGDV